MRYYADNFLNTIACKKSGRFCGSITRSCTAWEGTVRTSSTRAYSDFDQLIRSSVRNGTAEYKPIVNLIQFVSPSLLPTSMPHSIGDRPASSPLQAAR